MHYKRIAFGIMLTLLAVGAWASNFRAADTVYLPAVARIDISATSIYKTDVVISNLSSDSVDVDFALSEGQTGTPNAVSQANLKRIGTLAPFERKEIIDFVGTALGRTSRTLGQGIFFACRTGGNCQDCQTNSADCRLISVESRIYTESTSGCPSGAAKCTSGQLFSGIPWYNFVSSTASDKNLDKVFIAGIRQEGARNVNGYRSNVGFVNASNLGTVTLTATIYRNNAPTTAVSSFDITLGPLGQAQPAITDMFPGFTGSGFVVVQEKSFTPTTAGDPNAIPGWLTYGSILDNVSNDPTTLESQYFEELQWDCVYGAKPEKRPLKR